MIELREFLSGDEAAARDVEESAFGRADEADLVDRLRREGAAFLELVAEAHGEAVGHILFTTLPLEAGGQVIPAVALAPLAVKPKWQRKGLGAALIHRGLTMCRDRGAAAAVVVGEPEYYKRFGFSVELASGIECPFAGPYLQAIELAEDALRDFHGLARYAPPFTAG